jgi:hypothetical protein
MFIELNVKLMDQRLESFGEEFLDLMAILEGLELSL